MTARALLALAESCEQTARQARRVADEMHGERRPLRSNEVARSEASAKFRRARELLQGVRR